MHKFAADFIAKWRITPSKSDDPLPVLVEHVKMLLYNVVYTVAAVAIMSEPKKKTINEHNVDFAKYIFNASSSKHPGKMAGGTNMASEFFGVSSGAYSSASSATQGVTVSKVDFGAGVLRPSQGPMQGGGGFHPDLKKHMKTLMSERQIKASTKGLDAMEDVVNHYLNMLGKSLENKKVSAAKLEKTLQKRAFKIMN